MKTKTFYLKMKELKRSYTFYHMADGHVMILGQEEGEAEKKWAEQHYEKWFHNVGDPLETMSEMIDHMLEHGGDGLMIAGDQVDYISDINVTSIKKQLARLPMDILYVYGNHEGGSYTRQIDDTKVYYPVYEDVMYGNPSYWVKDYEDFLIVGMDNSAREITASQLAFLKEQIARKMPIIMVLHVPLYTEEIAGTVREKWGEQGHITFTIGTAEHSENAREFCSLIKSPDSNVAAIFAGHLHRAHVGEFAPGRLQYVAAPACEGYLYKVIIEPT